MRSTSSPLAVSMMIGVVSPVPRRRRQIDRPSSPGSIRSRTIRSKCSRVRSFVHLRRIADGLDLETLFAEVADQQVAQAAVVVDDEKAVLSVVHGAKDNPAVTVGMRSMVTSFFSGDDGNKLLQSPQAKPRDGPAKRCDNSSQYKKEGIEDARLAKDGAFAARADSLFGCRGGRACAVAARPAPPDASGNARTMAAGAAGRPAADA